MRIRNRDDWWSTVSSNWTDLLSVLEKTVDLYEKKEGLSLQQHLINLKDKQNDELVTWLTVAWNNAPDSAKIHSWDGWATLCMLLSEAGVLRDGD